MWKQEYKGCVITCDENGMFSIVENKNGDCRRIKNIQCGTLSVLKAQIDKELDSYYTITTKDYNTILGKLDQRERNFLNALVEELARHLGNAYCEMGISEAFEFDFSEEMWQSIKTY